MVDEGAAVLARVDAGDHCHRRWLCSPDLGEAESLAQVAERERDEACGQLREVGRCSGAAGRVPGDPDDAVLAQVNPEPAEAARIRWHDGAEPGKDAHHCRRSRRRLREVQSAWLAVEVVAQVDLDERLLRVDGYRDLHRDTVWHSRHRVVPALTDDAACWHLPDGCNHTLFAVVEPVALVLLERFHADLAEEFEQPALTDPRCAEQGEKVPVPEVGDADAGARHPEHVLTVTVVLLHLHAWEDERPFVVDVRRVGDIRCGHGVAAVGEVCFREDGVSVCAFVVEDRGDDAPVGGVGVPVVRRVVEEGVSAPQPRMGLLHVRRDEVRPAHHVDWQALRHREQLVAGGEDAAGEIASGVEDRRARGPQQRVHHRPGAAFEAIAQQRELKRRGLSLFSHSPPPRVESDRGSRQCRPQTG